MKNSSNMKTVALATAAFALVTASIRGQAPPTYRQQQAHPQVSTFDVVEARKFVLRDDSGLVRMEIGPNRNGNAVGLRFFDRKGVIRMNLAMSNDGDTVAVSIIDPQGSEKITMATTPGSAAVGIAGKHPAAIVSSADGQAVFAAGEGEETRAVIGVDAEGHPFRNP
jgi:hypothetical protein